MPIDPGPYNFDGHRIIMSPSGDATAKAITPRFFEELGEFGTFAGHLLISRFDFDEPWPTWEIHPHGDEFVYLLSGDVDFVLRTGEGDKTIHVDKPGSYVVVPKGTWHTARPHSPTTMLFVTPGEDTQNKETPD
ncbi:MAG: cupin domain-containing protein [Gammaproteobacteria bacterium]|nr:cupin domain-containing protein [Gammaproteobacteria bacterium]